MLNKRLICFDLDGTLTQHRSMMEEESRAVLDALQEKYTLRSGVFLYFKNAVDFGRAFQQQAGDLAVLTIYGDGQSAAGVFGNQLASGQFAAGP